MKTGISGSLVNTLSSTGVQDLGLLPETHEPAYSMEAFKAIVVELSDDFKKQLKGGYDKDNRWSKVINTLQGLLREADDVPTGVSFKLRNGGLLQYGACM